MRLLGETFRRVGGINRGERKVPSLHLNMSWHLTRMCQTWVSNEREWLSLRMGGTNRSRETEPKSGCCAGLCCCSTDRQTNRYSLASWLLRLLDRHAKAVSTNGWRCIYAPPCVCVLESVCVLVTHSHLQGDRAVPADRPGEHYSPSGPTSPWDSHKHKYTHKYSAE